MLVTTRANDTFTAYRGSLVGSHAAAEVPTPTLSTHSAGSTVAHFLSAGAENRIRADQHRSTFSGSLPTDGYKGDTLPTDDCVLSVHNGTSFLPAHPVYPYRANPNAQSWSWLNQVGATVSARSQSILLAGTANAGANLQCRVMTAPATQYCVVAVIQPVIADVTYCHAGVLLSDGTKISEIDMMTVNVRAVTNSGTNIQISQMQSAHYNNGTSFVGGNSLSWNTTLAVGYPITFLLQDDGTTRKFGYSPDGGLYIQSLFSESRTNFLTASQIGYFFDSNSSNMSGGIIVHSWYISPSTLF